MSDIGTTMSDIGTTMNDDLDKTDMEVYQDFVEETSQGSGIIWALQELSGEVGELNSLIAKAARKGTNINSDEFRNAFAEELGDALWGIAACANEMNLMLDDVIYHNIDKILRRREQTKAS